MASTAQSLRLGAGRCCTAASSTRTARTMQTVRTLTTTTRRWAKDDKAAAAADDKPKVHLAGSSKLEPWEVEMRLKFMANRRIKNISEAMRATLPASERSSIAVPPQQELEREGRLLAEVRREASDARHNRRVRKDWFWNRTEPDTEMHMEDMGELENHGDDMTSLAHGKLDELRGRRHYMRLAVWDMPLLSKLAKPFEPPSADMALRFRFTSYLGEYHPAEKKVVVEFCPADLGLTEAQQTKLKKLAGVRYNPETEIVRMSCEQFEHQAQNKRYLGDLVDKLVAAAKDPTDMFEDIPIETRHHPVRAKPKFPTAWRLTEARRKELQAFRAESFLRDQQMLVDGSLVDGRQRVAAALVAPKAEEKVPELVRR